MQAQIVLVDGEPAVFDWVNGLHKRQPLSLEEEARRNPTAVIARLMYQGRWTEAEEVMDRFLH
jgi:hypothetical protein